MLRIQEVTVRLGFGRLEIRLKAAARLDLEVSVGWASPSSHGLRGGDALLANPNTDARHAQWNGHSATRLARPDSVNGCADRSVGTTSLSYISLCPNPKPDSLPRPTLNAGTRPPRQCCPSRRARRHGRHDGRLRAAEGGGQRRAGCHRRCVGHAVWGVAPPTAAAEPGRPLAGEARGTEGA
jgi:hypothetical protein